MEVPRLGVKLEPPLLAYAIATAMPDLSCICDLHHSLWQWQILNPLSQARGRTCILMETSRICNSLSHNWNSTISLILNLPLKLLRFGQSKINTWKWNGYCFFFFFSCSFIFVYWYFVSNYLTFIAIVNSILVSSPSPTHLLLKNVFFFFSFKC